MLQAVTGARESLEGCFEVLQPQLADIGATWQDFLWAVQVITQPHKQLKAAVHCAGLHLSAWFACTVQCGICAIT